MSRQATMKRLDNDYDKRADLRVRAPMVQHRWRKIKKAQQRLVVCRLMIDMMRTVHGAYAPASERFGTRLETFFIALCVALGDIDGKPFQDAMSGDRDRTGSR